MQLTQSLPLTVRWHLHRRLAFVPNLSLTHDAIMAVTSEQGPASATRSAAYRLPVGVALPPIAAKVLLSSVSTPP